MLYAGLSLLGQQGRVGCVRRCVFGCFVGENTDDAMAAKRADRRRGGQKKFVAALTCCWRGVFGLGRVATLGSGRLATLGCGVNGGGTLGGSRQGETLGKFGGWLTGRGSAVVVLVDSLRHPVRCFRLPSTPLTPSPGTVTLGLRMESSLSSCVREVSVR